MTILLAAFTLATAAGPARADATPPAGAGPGAGPGVSLQSLLREMVDRDAPARLPRPAYVCKEASSHDRAKTDPADAKTWHSNKDFEQFIRTEENDGRHEWVIMDDDGPGAVTRFWLPLLAEQDNQVVRFYFDGSPTPAIAVKFNELLSGRAFVKPPLAFVVLERRGRAPPEGDAPQDDARRRRRPLPADPLRRSLQDHARPVAVLLHHQLPGVRAGDRRHDVHHGRLRGSEGRGGRGGADLDGCRPGSRTGRWTRQASGPRARRGDSPSTCRPAPQRSATCWCGSIRRTRRRRCAASSFKRRSTTSRPSGAPSASSSAPAPACNPVRDWDRTVGKDGTLRARWVMPYQHGGRLTSQERRRQAGRRPTRRRHRAVGVGRPLDALPRQLALPARPQDPADLRLELPRGARARASTSATRSRSSAR